VIRVVADSACDLPAGVAQDHGITVVPLVVRFGHDEFDDGVGLDATQFWKRMADDPQLPETSSPAPGKFEAAYRALTAGGATGIVCVTLSADLSSTYQSAVLAAGAAGVPVEVIDSRSVSLGAGFAALAAARVANGGGSLQQSAGAARAVARSTQVWGVLDTLENLRRGGRIGGAKALLASVLAVKPVIEVRDGRVEEGGRQRTRARAIAFLVDQVRAGGPVERVAVMHGEAPDVDVLVDRLRPLSAEPVLVTTMGAVIGAHAGPRCLGVAVQRQGVPESETGDR
jgi:DegV family protein with EDD domain